MFILSGLTDNMKLPNFRRLFKNDFKEEFQGLVDQLSVSINVGMESLYEALNKKLTFKDNFSCTVKDITVKVDSTGKPKSPITLPLDFYGKIDGVIVLYALNNTSSARYVSGGVHVSWTQTETGLSISNIAGLYADDEYSLRIVIFVQ